MLDLVGFYGFGLFRVRISGWPRFGLVGLFAVDLGIYGGLVVCCSVILLDFALWCCFLVVVVFPSVCELRFWVVSFWVCVF